MAEQNEGKVLGWDDEIEHDGLDFTILPEGDYDFEVISFERARFAGSEKLPACHMAIVNIRLKGEQGISTVKHRLYLHTKCEGLLCAFFSAIGQRKHGEKLKMNWSTVPGSVGRAQVGVRKWTNDQGKEIEFNEIKKFYEPEDRPATNFQAGRF